MKAAEATAQSKPVISAPAIPFRTFLNFIEWLGEVGVPQKIERSFWSRKLAGGTGPQVLSTFKFFGLLTEDLHATKELDDLAGNPDNRKETLKRLIVDKYSPILKNVAIERATRGQLNEEFQKAFSGRGSMLVKSVIFFVHMSRFAGLPVSNHIIVRERGEGKRKKRVHEPDVNNESAPHDIAKGKPQKQREDNRQSNGSPPMPEIAAQSSPLLWGMFQRLPKPGSSWDEAERELWLQTLQNVLSLEYKEK